MSPAIWLRLNEKWMMAEVWLCVQISAKAINNSLSVIRQVQINVSSRGFGVILLRNTTNELRKNAEVALFFFFSASFT